MACLDGDVVGAKSQRPGALTRRVRTTTEAARLALIAKRWVLPGLPVAVQLNASVRGIAEGDLGGFESALLREYLPTADRILAVDSETAEDTVSLIPALRDKVTRIPFWSAIDVDAVMSGQSDSALDRSCVPAAAVPMFVSVPMAAGDSGLRTLLNAASVASAKAELKVLVFGDDAESEALSAGLQTAAACFLPASEWTTDAVRRATAIIHVARGSEAGIPDEVVAALAEGCPVISAATAVEVKALIEDGPGLLFRLGDHEGLAEAMLQLAWDDDARARLAAQASDRLAAHSFDALAAEVEAVVLALLGRRPAKHDAKRRSLGPSSPAPVA